MRNGPGRHNSSGERVEKCRGFLPNSFDRVLLDAPCSALGLRPRLFSGEVWIQLLIHLLFSSLDLILVSYIHTKSCSITDIVLFLWVCYSFVPLANWMKQTLLFNDRGTVINILVLFLNIFCFYFLSAFTFRILWRRYEAMPSIRGGCLTRLYSLFARVESLCTQRKHSITWLHDTVS